MLPILAPSFSVKPDASAALVKAAPLPRPVAPPAPGGLMTLGNLLNQITRTLTPPEAPTTSAPPAKIYRAIDRVDTEVRLPDRGAWISTGGTQFTLPDGTVGGRPNTPMPLLSPLDKLMETIFKSGGNYQIRQTQVKALQQSMYTNRQQTRPRIAAPLFPAPDGKDYAMARRPKPTTPTGIQGDRAPMNPQSRTGFVYASRVTPAQALAAAVNGRTSGQAGNAITAPVALDPKLAPKPTLSAEEAVGKTYAWAAPRIEAGDTPQNTMGISEQLERYGLLVAVAVAAFFLIRSRG